MKQSTILLLALFFSFSAFATRIEPFYPQEALDRCISGYVILKFEVSAESVTVLEVEESEPVGMFDEAAKKNLELQKNWYISKSEPGSVVTKKFSFKIEDECTPKS